MSKSNYDNKSHGEILDDVFLFFHSHGIYDKAIICGGYFLSKVLGSRATVDIDMNVRDPLAWMEFKDIAMKCAEYLHKYDASIYVDIAEPTETTTARILFKTGSHEKVAGLDVGIQNLDYGVMQSILPVSTLSGQVVYVKMDSYSYERVLTDKISAAFSIKNLRRSKDFFDIHRILTSCALDYATFMKLFLESDLAEHPEWIPLYSPYNEDRFASLEHGWKRLLLRHPVTRDELEKPPIELVLKELSNFIRETNRCCAVCTYKWNTKTGRWVING